MYWRVTPCIIWKQGLLLYIPLQKEDGSIVLVFVLNVDSVDLIPHTATDVVYDLGKIVQTQILSST